MTAVQPHKNLHIYNTATRSVELFRPRQDPEVKFFSCGPSVYRMPHLGNYRTFLFEDVLQRYLEYLGYRVHRLINFTDVEDKAIEEANREGVTLRGLEMPVMRRFYADCKLLSIRLPERVIPSACCVDAAAEIIMVLEKRGHAYRYENDFYFDPLTFKGFGRLFGLDMNAWPKKKRRFGKDTYPGQQWNLGDFILWHGYRSGDTVYWNTPIGKGRPSWNIQDPAIIVKHLGTQIDIHCGGIDNLYRHHDYTLAIMEGYSGTLFSHYWLHGRHLLVKGKKMSKEKGNVLYPQSLADGKTGGKQVRFFLMDGHYRSTMNYTERARMESRERFATLAADASVFIKDLPETPYYALERCAAKDLLGAFEEAMNDDLHVDRAITSLLAILALLARKKRDGTLGGIDAAETAQALARIDTVLNVLF